MARPMGEREQDFRVYLSEKSDTIDARIDAILKTYEGSTLVQPKFSDVAIALGKLRNGDANFNQTFQDEDLSDDFEQRLDASIEALKKYKDESDSFWHKLLRFLGLGKETMCGTEVTELLENLQWVKDSVEIAKHDRDLLDHQNAQANKERTKDAAANQKDNTLSMNQQMDKQPSVAAQSAPVSQNPNVQMQQQASNAQAATTQSAPVNPNPNVQVSNARAAAAQSVPVNQNTNPNAKVQQGSNRKTSGFQMSHTDSFNLSPKGKKYSDNELRITKRHSVQISTSSEENKVNAETQADALKNNQTNEKKVENTKPTVNKKPIPMFSWVKESSDKKRGNDNQVNSPASTDASSKTVPKAEVKKYTDEEWEKLSQDERIKARRENEQREYLEDFKGLFNDSNDTWVAQMDSNQKEVLEELLQNAGTSDALKETRYAQYIQHRIDGIEKIDQLKASAKTIFEQQVPSELETTKTSENTKKYMLKDVSQPEMQRVSNGCWSVTLASMLGQKGVQIDQQTIRTYRPDHEYCNGDDIKNNNIDKGGNSITMFRDLAMDLVPDTALNRAQYATYTYGKDGKKPTKEQQEQAYADAKKGFSDLLRMAVLEDKSALGIDIDRHYRTIIGVETNGKDEIEKIHFFDPLHRDVQCETMDEMMEHFRTRLTDPPSVRYTFEAQWLHSVTNDKGEFTPGVDLGLCIQNKITYKEDGSLQRQGTANDLAQGENCISYKYGDNLAISSYLPKQLHGYKKTRVKSNLESLQQQEQKQIEPVNTEVKEKSPEKVNTVETTASKQKEGATQEIAKTVTNISTVKNEGDLTKKTESKSDLTNLKPAAQQKSAAVKKAKSRENKFQNKLTRENPQSKKRSLSRPAPAK